MKENIKKQDLKQIIIDTMNDVYIDKNKLCELLRETEWSDEKDYRLRYLDFHNKVLDLIGTEYYKIYNVLK